jgi:hypothetical protein
MACGVRSGTAGLNPVSTGRADSESSAARINGVRAGSGRGRRRVTDQGDDVDPCRGHATRRSEQAAAGQHWKEREKHQAFHLSPWIPACTIDPGLVQDGGKIALGHDQHVRIAAHPEGGDRAVDHQGKPPCKGVAATGARGPGLFGQEIEDLAVVVGGQIAKPGRNLGVFGGRRS